MASNFLKPDPVLDLTSAYLLWSNAVLWLPRYPYLAHLFFNCTSPKISSGLFVNRERFLDRLRYFNPKLVLCPQVSRFHLWNNQVSQFHLWNELHPI